VDIGIHFLNFTNPGGDEVIAPLLAQTAKTADDAGFALFTVMDHFFQMERVWPADEPMLEGYSALAFAAAHTSRIPLSVLVTGVTYRHPGVLAKTVTTLDVLSGGRAMLGIGAGWYEREHRGLGVPFPPLAERFERLEETIQICRQMWSEDDGPYAGTHYTLAETLNRPRPLAGSRLPILIGGSGERKTLRLVARYADVCNFTVSEVDEVRHKIDVLKRHCEREGRDFATIRVTVQGGAIDPTQDPDGFLRRAHEYAALGVHHIHVRVRQPDPVGFVARLAESVQPRLAEIEPSR
jgi:F420-dependent oxidoreductase-like protein